MKKSDIFFEIIFKLCTLSFVVMLILMAQSYSKDSRMLPQLVGGFIILLLLLSFAMDIIAKNGARKDDKEKKDNGSSTASYRRRRLLASFAVLITLAVICLGGIIFAFPAAFMAFVLLLRGKRDLLSLIYLPLILTGLVYVVFKYILYVPLMRGLLHEFGLF